MSQKIKEIISIIGVILIFVSAVISLVLRKDLGDTALSVQESTKLEEAKNKGTEKESIENIAQDSQVGAESETGHHLEAESNTEPEVIIAPENDLDVATLDLKEVILVNREHPLPKDYKVELRWLSNRREQVASEIYDDLQSMLSDGSNEGLQFVIASGYRSISEQQEIWDDTIRMWKRKGLGERAAADETAKTLAYPGESEHATGLAVDIVALDYQNLDDKQHDTKESTWLRENCHKYGFILRYPKDKEEITGITYESWHFRYVGREVATYIMEQGITLEEYIERIAQNSTNSTKD